jgi:spore coat protein U-like protein
MSVRVFLVLVALALLWPATARAAESCTTSVQPLAFGTIGTPTAQRDTTANITVTCLGTPGTPVRACLAVGAGAAPSSVLDRRMFNGAASVAYQITSLGGALWGDYTSAPGQEVSVPIASNGSGSAVVTMYGRIAAGQNVTAATYTASVQVQTRIPSGGSPCGNGTGNAQPATSFNVSADLRGTCTITASPINFGTVANLLTAQSASGSLAVACTIAMPYSIALNAGSTTGNTIAARKLSLGGSGPGIVSYQLYQDGGFSTLWGDGTTGATYPGTGTGTLQNIPVHARVPAQPTPASGTYRDTVTATITY